jgi:septal ring factor EnvC (AmiA/AmiB activator)
MHANRSNPAPHVAAALPPEERRTIPTTVKTDLFARAVRYLAGALIPLLLSALAAAWTISQRTAGYDRAAAMTTEDHAWIFEHEKALAEQSQKSAVATSETSQIRADIANIRTDIHEIRAAMLRLPAAPSLTPLMPGETQRFDIEGHEARDWKAQ